jgi:RNase P/RNase MRP subunit p30
MKRYNNLSKDYFHIFYSFFVKVRERLKVEIEKNTQLKDELERTKNEVIIIIQP